MHYEDCHICSIRRESVQCMEGHIWKQEVVQCEERLYTIRIVTFAGGDCVFV